MSIRDDFWLWGQVPNSHHEEGNNIYNLPGVNKMTPIEGAKFFGIKNICMVVMEDKPAVEEFPRMADELSSLDKVVWSEKALTNRFGDLKYSSPTWWIISIITCTSNLI